jgi:pimeloyl-ACP methyl ester carboxylesterase
MTWSEHTVHRDGVRLVVRDSGGTGQPLLLLHGLAGHSGEWDAVAEPLRDRHRLLALDQRGHGASERRPGDASRAAYVADAVGVLDALALPSAVLVGQSLGGHTAMLTAAAHPDRVSALVLIEAGPGGPDPAAPGTIARWLDSWPVPFPSLAEAAEFLGGGPIGEGWAAGLERRDDGWWPRFDRDTMVASVAENARSALWPQWSAVACPTLLVLAQSSFIPAEETAEMFRLRPATTALSVPGTRHDLHLQRPAAVHQAITAFLRDAEEAGNS